MEASAPGSKKKKAGGGGFPPADNTTVTGLPERDTAMAIRGKPAHSEEPGTGTPTKGSEVSGGGSSKESGGPSDLVKIGRKLGDAVSGENALAGLNRLNENLKDLNRALDPTPPHSYWITPSAPRIYKDLGRGAKILTDEAKRGDKNIREEAGRTQENIKDEAGRAQKNIGDEIGRVPENLADLMQGKNLGGGAEQLGKNVQAGAETVEGNVRAGYQRMEEGLGPTLGSANRAIGNEAQRFGHGIEGSTEKAGKDISAEAGRAEKNVIDEFQRAPGNLDHVPTGTDLSRGLEKLKDNTQAGVDRLNENLKGLNRSLLDATTGEHLHWVTTDAPVIYGEVRQGYKDTADEAGRLGQNVSKGVEKLEEAGKKAGQWLDKTTDRAGSDILKGAKQLEGAGKKVGGTIGKAGKEVGDAVSDAGDKAADELKKAKDKAEDTAQQGQETAEDAASDAGETVCNWFGC